MNAHAMLKVRIDEEYLLVDEHNKLPSGQLVHSTLVGKNYCKTHSSK
jgi:hypothetical protein